ncbi:MAG: helix-turn-helix domain-containing protein [Clostridia bacterium]|nr:helix-turn-helix domain-containing protein [Clostridia bacterium]
MAEGKTQAWIAEKTGISPAYVSRIVNRRKQIVSRAFLGMMDAPG